MSGIVGKCLSVAGDFSLSNRGIDDLDSLISNDIGFN